MEEETLQFCRENKISEEIQDTLKSNGLTNLQDVLDLDGDDMKEMGLNMGQRKQLKRALNNFSMGGTDDELPDKISNLHVSSSPRRTTSKIYDVDEHQGWIAKNFKKIKSHLPERLQRFTDAMFGEGETNFEPDEEEQIGNLTIKRCKLKEVHCDPESKIRKCIAGRISPRLIQKTLIMVGATGSGKSTLIDGIANYMFSVSWDENYRLKLVSMTKEEKENAKRGQSTSQTDWITVYSIPPGSETETDYVLNIVDTPGFADTRGIDRDEQLVDQIRNFMCNPKPHGIDMVNGICFVVQAPNARLTPQQKYVFNAIFSMFGKDVQDNIFVMTTFADGDVPPVIASLEEAEIRYKRYFPFNNSALYAPTNENANNFTRMFWDLGINSYKNFLTDLKMISSTSLTLSAKVLKKREMLSNSIDYIQKNIQIGCQKLNRLAVEQKIMKQHEDDIKANRDFEYEVTEEILETEKVPTGTFTTNCSNCHVTCHPNCAYENDEDKVRCVAMDTSGNCTVCKENCNWNHHYNQGYVHVLTTKKVKKTYYDMKDRYDQAKNHVDSKGNILKKLQHEIDEVEKEIFKNVQTSRKCLGELYMIALKQDTPGNEQYIELLIHDERKSLADGWEQRVSMLEKFKGRATLTSMVQSNHDVKELLKASLH